MDSYSESILVPWFEIWTKPKKTFRQILGTNSSRWILLLAAAGGIQEVIELAFIKSLGDQYSFSVILLAALLGGPLLGILGLFLFGALISWTGKLIDGRASASQIRTAMAWGWYYPHIWILLICWLPVLLLAGSEAFTTATPFLDAHSSLTSVLSFTIDIGGIIYIWGFVVSFKCIEEAQGFSAWRALGNAFLAGFVVAVLVFILAIIAFFLL